MITGRARSPAKRTTEQQDDDRADYRDEHAVEVEAGHSRLAEGGEEPAADDRADDAKQDVDEQPLAGLVDDLAGDEAGNQSEDDPGDDRHRALFRGEGLC